MKCRYLPECAHPYFRFARAGFSVEFASPHGGLTHVSTSSLDLSDAENKEFWENPALRSLTENTKPLSECSASDYDIIFFVGGFGVMFDFPNDENIQRLSREIYEKGGIVSAVCHGPIALANVRLSDGQYLVTGKEVTAFCNAEEEIVGLLSKLPEHEGAGKTCEDVLIARGAKFTTASAPFGGNIAVSGRLLTGQNPASAGLVGDAIVSTVRELGI
jgi:putative intracellular protease/amidase